MEIPAHGWTISGQTKPPINHDHSQFNARNFNHLGSMAKSRITLTNAVLPVAPPRAHP